MTEIRWLEEVWPEIDALPLETFMERCLYHPQHGYYERDITQIGPQGDFLTCVNSTPLFGRLLACQFADWLSKLGQFTLVEAGAHDGTLAHDILTALNTDAPNLARNVQYWIVEPSLRRQQTQRTRLEHFAGQVRWMSSLEQVPPLAGVIFSNELLDAFPVRRFGWDATRQLWFECGVRKESGSRLGWARLPLDPAAASRVLIDAGLEWSPALGRVLPEGYTVDLCPSAAAWWSTAASLLQKGWLLTVDYGFLAEEMFAPHRTAGTLRAYQGHHQFADVLTAPGQRDLTAHVHFTQLIRLGEAAGLRTEELWTQEKFFMRIARDMGEERLRALSTPGLRSLVHPDRQPFRVLIQRRDAAHASSD